jgi:hypothetical protein
MNDPNSLQPPMEPASQGSKKEKKPFLPNHWSGWIVAGILIGVVFGQIGWIIGGLMILAGILQLIMSKMK